LFKGLSTKPSLGPFSPWTLINIGIRAGLLGIVGIESKMGRALKIAWLKNLGEIN